MPAYLLAIDQGTTSTRSIVFRADLTVADSAQEEFRSSIRLQDLSNTILRICGARPSIR